MAPAVWKTPSSSSPALPNPPPSCATPASSPSPAPPPLPHPSASTARLTSPASPRTTTPSPPSSKPALASRLAVRASRCTPTPSTLDSTTSRSRATPSSTSTPPAAPSPTLASCSTKRPCGTVDRSADAFKLTTRRNLVCWTAMITGLTVNGRGRETAELFDRMVGAAVRLDRVVFISALSACSHSGLVYEGKRLSDEMNSRFGLAPGPEHYGCMVDLLGRVGRLDEALGVIRSAPVSDGIVVLWCTLLGASSVRGRVETAELAMS